MDFSFIQFNPDSLISPGFNAIHFSVVGMVVVFGGLTLIALYIALLPRMLKWASHVKRRALPAAIPLSDGSESPDNNILDTETLLAIAVALHLDQFSNSTNSKITWKRHGHWDSSWQRAGRFEAMNLHGHLSPPRR